MAIAAAAQYRKRMKRGMTRHPRVSCEGTATVGGFLTFWKTHARSASINSAAVAIPFHSS
jgi:hypothetical protein